MTKERGKVAMKKRLTRWQTLVELAGAQKLIRTP